MKMPKPAPNSPNLRERLRILIFEADTKAARLFDVVLIVAIVLSVFIVMLDSVTQIKVEHGDLLFWAEWGFTLLFTVEYALRLGTIKRPLRYAFSFYGIIDLLAILPTYLSLLLPGSQYFTVVRVLRVLRIFRILKLAKYLSEANHLASALAASRRKITIFLAAVVTLVIILGSVMYILEGPENGFTSIPKSMYWAIVTLTTVGYGDISPNTPWGQALASFVMILGYAIIAVPTGIISAEIAQAKPPKLSTRVCPHCLADQHDEDAIYCKICGNSMQTSTEN